MWLPSSECSMACLQDNRSLLPGDDAMSVGTAFGPRVPQHTASRRKVSPSRHPDSWQHLINLHPFTEKLWAEDKVCPCRISKVKTDHPYGDMACGHSERERERGADKHHCSPPAPHLSWTNSRFGRHLVLLCHSKAASTPWRHVWANVDTSLEFT